MCPNVHVLNPSLLRRQWHHLSPRSFDDAKRPPEKGLLAVTAVRLVPIAPFVVINVVAGAMRISLLNYVLGTLIGMLPGTLTATVFGDQVNNILRGDINYFMLGGILVGVIIMFTLIKRWLNTEEKTPPVAQGAQ